MSIAAYRRYSTATKNKRVITGINVRLDNELRGIKAGIHAFRSTVAREKASQEASRKASIVEASRQRRAPKWVPVVGERVRISSMGYEGTLRFYGATEFKEGVWAGVELEGGFKGKGKNDGNVGGVQYFSCPPNCGIFVTAVKLSQPTTGASHPPLPHAIVHKPPTLYPAAPLPPCLAELPLPDLHLSPQAVPRVPSHQ
ncbi:hypothetical protein L198_06107 [Cryptococcus wingfieldii CBS 7118]|uniref:CAP-Gly domain-containing protein n=1 Tax=Cryptococcus wingfieldii CBS 7118 TaxID=1295528 RepID=A0A1E3IQA8_9TREE|nr:hypothetical protein L198_06107 [Cryptococcus wingfieldii CBS 7118]ODN90790.1 hypothetical protein L198_06107 [Cryptococcus wingfieldii CBS 7118]